MKSAGPTRHAAFTLIELLVVIAIMAIIAGLVVGLNTIASEKKKISRAQIERDRLVMLIEAYKTKVGTYPPDNRKSPFNPGVNTLFYELAGAERNKSDPGNPNYITPFGSIRSNVLQNTFGIGGMLNASDDVVDLDRKQFNRFLRELKPDQTNEVAPGTISFVVPIDGPGASPRPNPWKYATGANAVHNPESFDLWVDIVVRGQTRTIGNWKE